MNMKLTTLVALFLSFAGCKKETASSNSAAQQSSAQLKPDRESLQGSWIPMSGSEGTRILVGEKDFGREEVWAFVGDKCRLGTQEGTYILRAEKAPKELDIVIQGKHAATIPCIYELTPDSFRVAFAEERPKTFEPGERKKTVLFRREGSR